MCTWKDEEKLCEGLGIVIRSGIADKYLVQGE
jgi:hypothetical protein